jgi:hypothetical protein
VKKYILIKSKKVKAEDYQPGVLFYDYTFVSNISDNLSVIEFNRILDNLYTVNKENGYNYYKDIYIPKINSDDIDRLKFSGASILFSDGTYCYIIIDTTLENKKSIIRELKLNMLEI